MDFEPGKLKASDPGAIVDRRDRLAPSGWLRNASTSSPLIGPLLVGVRVETSLNQR